MDYNGKYIFRGIGNRYSVCWLKLNRVTNTVLVTELAENEGTQIATMDDELAMEICKKFNLDPNALTWIEQYGKLAYQSELAFNALSKGKDKYFQVQFTPLEYNQPLGITEELEVLMGKTWYFSRLESVRQELSEEEVQVFLEKLGS